MFGFSKKKSGGPQQPAGPRIPTERVSSLSSQGLSEPEIIKTLREEGYSPLEVDRGMKEALRTGTGAQMAPPPPQQPVQPPPPRKEPPQSPYGTSTPHLQPSSQPPPQAASQPPGSAFPQQLPKSGFTPTAWEGDDDLDADFGKPLPREKKLGPEPFLSDMDEELPPIPEREEREPLPFARQPLPRGGEDKRRMEIEELTEQITDEKWQEMLNRVRTLEDKIDGAEAQLKSGETAHGEVPSVPEIENLKQDLEDQKNSINETNARIDSLEEVVKGSLTPMMESIRKFSHAVKTVKGEPIQSSQSTPAAAETQKPEEKK